MIIIQECCTYRPTDIRSSTSTRTLVHFSFFQYREHFLQEICHSKCNVLRINNHLKCCTYHPVDKSSYSTTTAFFLLEYLPRNIFKHVPSHCWLIFLYQYCTRLFFLSNVAIQHFSKQYYTLNA